MPRKVLTDEERKARKKASFQKLMNSYKTYEGERGSREKWSKIADILWSVDSHTNNFKILGLSGFPSTIDDLKKAWKAQAVKNHPDRGGDPKLSAKINEAYDQLKRFYFKTPIQEKKDCITPAKAVHISYENYDLLWKDASFINGNFVVEVKLDGSRYMLYIEENSKLLSRRISEVTHNFVDKTLHCPHLTRATLPQELWGTVLDGELIHPQVEKSDATTSIMGCSSEEAVNRQLKNGWLIFRIYDIPRIKGEDISDLPLFERRKRLISIVEELKKYLPVEIHEQFPSSQAKTLYEKTVKNGGEGVMLKDINAPYGKGWFKVKKTVTWDCVIMGFSAPKKTSKKVDGTVSPTIYAKENLIGSIVYGLYIEGVLTEVGRCSGVSIDIRRKISENPESFIGRVIEIKAQEMTKSGSFRHARFVRFREDKSALQCTNKSNS